MGGRHRGEFEQQQQRTEGSSDDGGGDSGASTTGDNKYLVGGTDGTSGEMEDIRGWQRVTR